jgi:undecaprenyl-diphosphatase
MSFADIIAFDARLSQRLRVAEQPGPLRTIAAFLAHSGDSWFWLVALPILWYFGDPSWKSLALTLVAAILVTATIVLTLKFIIRRRRPEGEWGQIYRKTDPHSFPSGHAARGILLGVIGLGLGPAWFGLLLIVWGPLVGLARIAMGVHYVSDVVAGWVLGLVIGLVTLQVAPLFLF